MPNVQLLVPWPFHPKAFGRSNQFIMRPLGVNENTLMKKMPSFDYKSQQHLTMAHLHLWQFPLIWQALLGNYTLIHPCFTYSSIHVSHTHSTIIYILIHPHFTYLFIHVSFRLVFHLATIGQYMYNLGTNMW
jgi:hypothetical protein